MSTVACKKWHLKDFHKKLLLIDWISLPLINQKEKNIDVFQDKASSFKICFCALKDYLNDHFRTRPRRILRTIY